MNEFITWIFTHPLIAMLFVMLFAVLWIMVGLIIYFMPDNLYVALLNGFAPKDNMEK